MLASFLTQSIGMNDAMKRLAICVAALLPVAVIAVLVMRDSSDVVAPALSMNDEKQGELVARADDDDDADDVSEKKPESVVPVVPAVVPVTTTPSTTTPNTTAPSTTTPSTAPAFSYTDGTYNATGTYRSPGGTDAVQVMVVLKSDVIVDVSVVGKTTNETSKMYIDAFTSGYKTLVVGKNIDDVQLSKVSGSSLTPKGFNEALNAIKTQAAV